MVRKSRLGGGVFAFVAVLSACAVNVDSPLSEQSSDTIVGGKDAYIGDVPWQVALRVNGQQFCGGSILNEEWVLTAQHCTEAVAGYTVQVVAGITRQSDTGGQTRDVAEVYPFPGFSSPISGKDVALLRLSTLVDLNGSTTAAIALVDDQAVANGVTDAGVMALVSGWGILDEQGWQSPDVLQSAEVPIIDLAAAQNAYAAYVNTIDVDQIPAGYLGTGQIDSCSGDSGGPLAVPDEAGTGYVLAGVVSWGYGCARADFPGMYGRVSAFNSWINDTIAQNSVLTHP